MRKKGVFCHILQTAVYTLFTVVDGLFTNVDINYIYIMPLIILITLILLSCSSDLVYNEPTPRIFVEAGIYKNGIFKDSDTILKNDEVHFSAEIEIKPPLDSIDSLKFYIKNYSWVIDTIVYQWRTSVKHTFKATGVYNSTFYVIDHLNDTLAINSTITVIEEENEP